MTPDVVKAVENSKGGQVNYRVDKQGNIHAGIGKISFDENSIQSNLTAFISSINKQKPASAKGKYIESASLSLSMSPSVVLDEMELVEIK